MADKDQKISSGNAEKDIAKVKSAFDSTATIDGNKAVTPTTYVSTIMVTLSIGILMLMGLQVLMSKVKAESNEDGQHGVVRVIGLLIVSLVMLLGFIITTTLA